MFAEQLLGWSIQPSAHASRVLEPISQSRFALFAFARFGGVFFEHGEWRNRRGSERRTWRFLSKNILVFLVEADVVHTGQSEIAYFHLHGLLQQEYIAGLGEILNEKC